MAPADALHQDNILNLAVKAIQPAGDRQPSLKTPYEAVALIGHACMVAVDFRLVGLSEDHNLETSTDTPSLPAEWNANDTFAFRYAHAQSSMQYLLKVSRLGNNAVIFALALGDDRTSSFDIPVKDFISTSALPLSSSDNTTASLRDVFISAARLGDLVGLFKINVIQKLAPGLYKEGYEDPSQPSRSRPQEERQPDIPREGSLPEPARPRPFDDPLAAAPRRSNPPDFAPPGFEDEFEINRPPRGYPGGYPGGLGGRSPYNIGERDLYPAGLGPNDPLRGSMGPGFGPSGGGMHPTFDDPLFGGRGAGNGGYDPRVPPGARYDPVGPGEPPVGRNQGPFGNNGRGRGGGGFGGFGGGGGFGGDII